MVRFTENSFVIEIPAHDAVEAWQETHTQLVELLKTADRADTTPDTYYRVYELLQAMLPSYNAAKNLIDEEIEKAP